MYKNILVTLDRTATDRVIIEHIKLLAKAMQSRVVLLHVCAGATAKYHGKNAAGREIEEGQIYLARVQSELTAAGIDTDTELACGQPVKEIVKWVHKKKPDLVAMGTHGHHFVADLVLGTTAITVQHKVSVPVLLLRAK